MDMIHRTRIRVPVQAFFSTIVGPGMLSAINNQTVNSTGNHQSKLTERVRSIRLTRLLLRGVSSGRLEQSIFLLLGWIGMERGWR